MVFTLQVSSRLGAVFVALLTLDASGAGKLTWERQQIDQVAGADDKKAVAVFRFKNEGDAPVTIASVKPTCGCTTAELVQDVYAPGEKGEIKAIFTFENRVPFQQKTIDVTTDSATDRNVSLILRVTLQEPIKCSSTLVMWNVGDEPREMSVTISPAGAQKIVALEAKASTQSAVTLKIERTANGSYRIGVQPTSTAQTMHATLSCVATFDEGTQHHFQLHALVR